MISIRAELERSEELERIGQLKNLVVRDYSEAIGSVAEYAVEVDSRHASDFREHLLALQNVAASAVTAGDYEKVKSSFRGELREYRTKAAREISRIHAEMQSAAVALNSVAESVTSTGSDLEVQVTGEIQRLETAASTCDLTEIQVAIREATTGLKASYEQLRRRNGLIVAQLQDELRSLHKEIAEQRRALYTDRSSGAWNRSKLDERIAQLLAQRDAFWVLFIHLEWKEPAGAVLPQDWLQGALRGLVERLQNIMGSDATIGRWEQTVFAAIIETEPEDEHAICNTVQGKVSGTYALQDGGTASTTVLNAWVAPAPCPKGTKEEEFYLRVGQVLETLAAR